MNLVELGKVLEEARKARGMPRVELARRVGVNPSYVWMIERARGREGVEPSQPSKEVLKNWAKALGWEARDDAPYTRQLLVLAGHLSDEVAKPAAAPLPFGSTALWYGGHQPRGLERERLIQELRRLLEKADASDQTGWDATVEVMKTILGWLGHLIDSPAVNAGQWSDTVRDLRSYLEWLEFRVRGKV